MPDFKIEKEMIGKGFKAVAGVDEAGRGALLGPVVASAVIFPSKLIRGKKKEWIEEINDSKLISPQKRERLAKLILTHASSIGIGLTTNIEIDKENIFWASLEAMRRAIQNLTKAPDFLLVDGCSLNDVNYLQIGLPHGDRKSISIAAASIIAKVLRDKMMTHMDTIYEGYAISKNKGYGTREHFKALKNMGPTAFHRLTFNLANEKEI